jgi:hypothetical protein
MSAMSAVRRFAAWFLFLALWLAPNAQAGAQASEAVQYFPETGHNVKGEFLRFYKDALNPVLVYGYPITEQFRSRDGKVVQYFQRARFELNPDAPGNQNVQLTPLGEVAHDEGNQRLQPANVS